MHIQSFFLLCFDYRLPALSVFIVTLATYATLGFAGRIAATQGAARLSWLGGGAFSMGIGIWSMHYIGMKTLGLSVPVLQGSLTVFLSILATILASAVTLLVVSRTGGPGRFSPMQLSSALSVRLWCKQLRAV
jgi:NO-binding membrane sensor protein with MHYT domain